MEKSAIVFEKNSDYIYHTSDNYYEAKICAKKDDIASIDILVNDKYLNVGGIFTNESEVFHLTNKYQTATQDIFVGRFSFSGVVMAVFFKITDKSGEVTYYGAYRFYDEYINSIGQSFDIVPYLLRQKTFNIPTWAKGSLMYQIFSERYAPTDIPSPNWNDELTGGYTFTNGTLKGIEKKLDYIHDLGVEVVYLTPIFKASTNHRYDTEDYYQIDPRLGTKEDLLSLVNSTHKKGMKFVMDLVFNHTSTKFFAFQDILKNQENSKYKDWYVIEKFPVVGPSNVTYKCFSRVGEMPKLNTANEEVQNYLLDVTKYYCENFALDGIRIDVADEIDLSFLRRMRKLVKSISNDIMIYGELWFDAMSYLQGDIFDSVMNYQFFNYTYEFIDGKIDSNTYGEFINQMYSRFHLNIQDSILNILSSHDTERILSRLKNDKDLVKVAFTLLFLMKGSSMLYYGEENGLLSNGYHYNRGGMKFEQDEHLTPFINKLVEIKKLPAFKLGDIQISHTNKEKVFAFTRFDNANEYCVVVNLSEEQYLLADKVINLISNEQTLSVSPKDVCIYQIK